uniref:NADH:ubiquinone reductase (non-electrogenic) n=1 Tax=Odontella aurita TaxID=265563 RepID=A0A7S4IZG0_9STRA
MADGPLKKKIERALKPRAYPLFLAEKAAQIVEGALPKSVDEDGGGISNGEKEKIVVLGVGWGAAAFLKDIDTSKFDVTVISPRNFFLFTPMLAGSAVGTVDYRSITEPVRQINPKANYLEATATSIDPEAGTVSCESVVCEGTSCAIEDFAVPYDKLLVTVGAQTNTFGIPGVREHCCFLKQVEDARRIRTAIVNCFERANLPYLSDDERRATLTFAVIGAGPTGIEFASELRDFVESDGAKYYPDLIRFVKVKVIEASPTVLAPFDESLQEEAIRQLERPTRVKDEAVASKLPPDFKLTELLLNSGVAEVKESSIALTTGEDIPYGIAVWAAGNGPLPITLQVIDALKEREEGAEGGAAETSSEQADAQDAARGRLAVDPWLRALGGEGRILALGDCSCVVTGQLPATAQVASQQGEYLAKLLSGGYDFFPGRDEAEGIVLPPARGRGGDDGGEKSMSVSESIAAFACQSGGDFAAPFQFLNLGILAYTGGGSALAQLQVTPDERGRVKGSGKVGFGLWRSVYLSKQVSWRNRFLVFVDWTKAQLFGRDITRV